MPVSSQILSGSFLSSASTPLTITSSSHQTEGDITASREKTFGNQSPSVITSNPPRDDPPSPVNSASGLVRYFESMNGFNSWIKNFPYLRARPRLRFFRFALLSMIAACRGVFVNAIRAGIGNRHNDNRLD